MSEKITFGPYYTHRSPARRWRDFLLWAEDGLVVIEDQRDGVITVLSVKDAVSRRDHFAEEADRRDLDKSSSGDPQVRVWAMEAYENLKGMIQALDECIRDAREQGDQNDPEVRRRKLSAFVRERRAGMGEGYTSTDKVVEELFMPGVAGPVVVRPSNRHAVFNGPLVPPPPLRN